MWPVARNDVPDASNPAPSARGALGPWVPQVILVGLAGLALFVYFFRLGVPTWRGDEILYRDAGEGYLTGDFSQNLEVSLAPKYVLGAAKDLFGSGPIAVRAPTAAVGLLTGCLLALLAGRVGGWWAAVLAFALWCLLPRPSIIGTVDVEQIKIERYARPDVYMGLFVGAVLLCAWRWAETGRWVWTLATGASVGLAAATRSSPRGDPAGRVGCRPRESRAVAPLAWSGGCADRHRRGGLHPHLPPLIFAGRASAAIDVMRDQKDLVPLLGHPFVFDGAYYDTPPWWASAWWQWQSLGTPATVSMAVCFLLAPFVLRRGLAVLLVGATASFALVISFWLGWSLPHYYYAWQPPLVLTCALVLYSLARRGTGARAAAALLALPLVLASLGTVRDVARLEPRDYAVGGAGSSEMPCAPAASRLPAAAS